jgi:hypothetical protein
MTMTETGVWYWIRGLVVRDLRRIIVIIVSGLVITALNNALMLDDRSGTLDHRILFYVAAEIGSRGDARR